MHIKLKCCRNNELQREEKNLNLNLKEQNFLGRNTQTKKVSVGGKKSLSLNFFFHPSIKTFYAFSLKTLDHNQVKLSPLFLVIKSGENFFPPNLWFPVQMTPDFGSFTAKKN